MRRTVLAWCALVLGGMCGTASATSIEYRLSNVSSNTWQYDFTVNNDSLGVEVDEFSIFFALGGFANLQVVAQPGSWDNVVLPPDPLLPADGLFDFFALGAGIGAGGSLAGFDVQVDFFGAGVPGGTPFTIVDQNNFAVPLDSGMTTPVGGVTPVDEPGTLSLSAGVLLALAVACSTRRRRGQSRPN
jgi:hypothetical protein